MRYITPIAGDYRVEIALNDALDCEVDEATLNDLALNMVLEINHLRAQLVAAKSRQSRGSVRELRGRLAAGLRRVIMPLHRPASVILEYIPESSPIAAASEVVRDMLQSQMASIERILEADVGSVAVSAASARLHMSKLAQRWKTFLNPRNTSFTVTVWPAPMPSHCEVEVSRAASSVPVPPRIALSLLLDSACGTLPTAVVVGGSGKCAILPKFDAAGGLHLDLELDFSRSGEHTVHVLLAEQHVIGSPLTLLVEVPNELTAADVFLAADAAARMGEDGTEKTDGGGSEQIGRTAAPEARVRRPLAVYLANRPSTGSVAAGETDTKLPSKLEHQLEAETSTGKASQAELASTQERLPERTKKLKAETAAHAENAELASMQQLLTELDAATSSLPLGFGGVTPPTTADRVGAAAAFAAAHMLYAPPSTSAESCTSASPVPAGASSMGSGSDQDRDVATHSSQDSDCTIAQLPQHWARLCAASDDVRLLGSPPGPPSVHAHTSHKLMHTRTPAHSSTCCTLLL